LLFYVDFQIKLNLAPAGFKLINPAWSGSGRIWKFGIRYIPTTFLLLATCWIGICLMSCYFKFYSVHAV